MHRDVNHLRAIEDRQGSGFAALASQLLEAWTRLLPNTQLPKEYIANLKGLQPQPVRFLLLVLRDISPRFKGSQQAKDVVLGQAEFLCKVRDTQFLMVVIEGPKDIQRPCHRSDLTL
jgi:hypothetical protein